MTSHSHILRYSRSDESVPRKSTKQVGKFLSVSLHTKTPLPFRQSHSSDLTVLGWVFSRVRVRGVRPSPLPMAASGEATERPRTAPRIDLLVVESRSNNFRRTPDHLWPYRPCRRRQGQTCTHDSRDDLLQRRAGRATRSTTPSNSTSELLR